MGELTGKWKERDGVTGFGTWPKSL